MVRKLSCQVGTGKDIKMAFRMKVNTGENGMNLGGRLIANH
jgi:hypothetical protein